VNWVDRYRERFEWELAEFQRLGLNFVLDEDELRRGGSVLLRGTIEVADAADPVALVVRYPDSFPFFRPEVYAPELQLGRHQNPIDKNLCLLDRSTRAWDSDESAAHLIVEQVPHLIHVVREGGETLREAEVPQGEPFSTYFPNEPGAVVLLGEEFLNLPPDVRSGTATIAAPSNQTLALRLRGYMQSVTGAANGDPERLATASGWTADRFAGDSTTIGWARIDELPPRRSPLELLNAAKTVSTGAVRDRWHNVAGGAISVVGVVFREEVAQGEFGDQWLFVVKVRRKGIREEQLYITHGQRFTPDEMSARIPQLSALRDKTVALIGLGALGAPLAHELCRNGVGTLRILDFDSVDAGTTVRWPYGVSAIGAPKVGFIEQVFGADYPFTKIESFPRYLGLVSTLPQESDFDLLTRMFQGVNLVIDASAEVGVQHLVSTIADELNVPQLYVWATEGARGGAVARVIPPGSGCWMCLQERIADLSVPVAPSDPGATIQPRGCATRTFTGASFNLAPIPTQAMRVATATLLGDRAGSDDDIFVCSIDAGLSAAPPAWESSKLNRVEGCSCCGAASEAA
jgi:hypothetical protein